MYHLKPVIAKEEDPVLAAITEYNAYSETQKNFEWPLAEITIDESNENSTEVHINITYKDQGFRFDSAKPYHAELFDTFLNSQKLVRAKYADGKVLPKAVTEARVGVFCNRFNQKNNSDKSYLWSGFAVYDAETDDFVGLSNLGFSGKAGFAEMAYLNRADSWSNVPADIIEEYNIESALRLKKQYHGIATMEVCTLLQYSRFLKERGNLLKDNEVLGVVATARLDNPGSWMACAKAGMAVTAIDANPSYGPDLRYQLLYKM